jgi:Arc/MetJ family transcription regulator
MKIRHLAPHFHGECVACADGPNGPYQVRAQDRVDVDILLLKRAQELTGIPDVDEVVHRGLQLLVRIESARRPAALGVTQARSRMSSRRRRRSG